MEPRYGGDALVLTALVESVAGVLRILRRAFPNGKQKIVNRVAQIEKLDVGLKAQTKAAGIDAGEVCGLENRFRFAVKGFNIGLIQAGHIQQFSAGARPAG